jgi:DNA-binding response OmpR family regulator
MLQTPVTSPDAVLPSLLWVDMDQANGAYCDMLTGQFRVSRSDAAQSAIQFLRRTSAPPDFVVTQLEFAEGAGYEICRAAKSAAVPSSVLIMTSVAERVPDAIVAGCDAVLLKPFAPNLLLSRLARLKRARFAGLHVRTERALARSRDLREQTAGTAKRIFDDRPDISCPHCHHKGVTGFEYSSHRRSWYACLSCHKVWLARWGQEP